jgi:hypothetical protein
MERDGFFGLEFVMEPFHSPALQHHLFSVPTWDTRRSLAEEEEEEIEEADIFM